MHKWVKERLSLEIVIGAAGASVLFCILCGLLFYFFLPVDSAPEGKEAAAITIVPYPSSTPTANPTLIPVQPTVNPNSNGLFIGAIARVTNSANGGLNLRSAPGVNNTSLFLAYEGENFQVKDGPVTADGYTWWNLAAADDGSISGWAVGDYLEVVTSP